MAPAFPLPFELVRWRTRRFAVSDFRFVVFGRGAIAQEIALHDISRIEVAASLAERITGIGTLVVHSARPGEDPLRVPRVAAVRRAVLRLELFVSEARGLPPADEVVELPLSSFWSIPSTLKLQAALVAPTIVVITLVGIGIGLSGHTVPMAYPDDDAIRPRGVRRSEGEIVAFMEREVMPWARNALAPVVGRERVTCELCHGRNAEERKWTMPAVRALPEPSVRAMAPTAGSDAEMRNALHGYLAEGDNQAVAAYMRGVIVPGMASLLHRPAYDFAQSYEYNRSRAAFGCYHCHQVGGP